MLSLIWLKIYPLSGTTTIVVVHRPNRILRITETVLPALRRSYGKILSGRPNLLRIGRKMLTTGNQLRAARSLAGLNQLQLAKLAGVNVSTISAMENKGAMVLGSGIDTIKQIMDALDAAGVEVLNDYGLPGCRLRPS